MPSLLRKKRILLGVTGGIASYKSPDLVRRLKERGALVQVVMTAGAQQFVTPLTFQAVSGLTVRGELFDREAEAAMGHIELARWADLIIVAPASANFIARLAQGRADDLLTTICLASESPIGIAPAMNRVMWSDAATASNVKLLLKRQVHMIGPGEGDQACGETGAGRMSEPTEIVTEIEHVLGSMRRDGPLRNKRIMVTAGPTHERLDPVRYLTNRSSGKMGYALARAALDMGAHVTLISGPVTLSAPDDVDLVKVESAQQMYKAVHRDIEDTDIFIAAAAVADFRPKVISDRKIKKTEVLGQHSEGQVSQDQILLEPCEDILMSVSHLDQAPFTVGFAAETDDIELYARSKLKNKKLNMIAANQVGDTDLGSKMMGFESDDNALLVITPESSYELPLTDKYRLAQQLIRLVIVEYQKTGSQ